MLLRCLLVLVSAGFVSSGPDLAGVQAPRADAPYFLPMSFEPRRPGTWDREQRLAHHELVSRIVADVDNSPAKALAPAVQELKEFIESNARIYMYFVQMFHEIPSGNPFWRDPVGNKTIRDYHHFLQVLNHIVTTGPDWPVTEKGLIAAGIPIIVIFDWPMATQSGYAAFLDPSVNQALKKVLNEWGQFLKSTNSSYVLNENDNGWFSPVARRYLEQAVNTPRNTSLTLCQLYECDPSLTHYGFSSWDDFFTRRFRNGIRPVASPADDTVVTAPCEAKPANLQRNVSLRANFFIKSQPYSVIDMLNHDPLAESFAGGTVYQGFLSSLAYHRWHAPVSGIVRRAVAVDGTYASLPTFDTIAVTHNEALDDLRIDFATGYISALATRAIIIIEADNKDLGYVAFIAVGMDEVSTCEITIKDGQRVNKGDEMGMFHFGGSTHCLLFQKGVHVEDFPSLNKTDNVPVRGQLAVVKPASLRKA